MEDSGCSAKATIDFLVISRTKAVLAKLLSLNRSRKSHGSNKLLPFHNDGAYCAPGDMAVNHCM